MFTRTMLMWGMPPRHVLVPVHVPMSLPRGDADQMGRIESSSIPLGDAQPGVSRHGDPAAAPDLDCQPFDNVVVVAGILRAEVVGVTFAHAHASGVHEHHGVVMEHPVSWVRAFPGIQTGGGAFGHVTAVGVADRSATKS